MICKTLFFKKCKVFLQWCKETLQCFTISSLLTARDTIHGRMYPQPRNLGVIMTIQENVVHGAIKAKILLAHHGGILLGRMKENHYLPP